MRGATVSSALYLLVNDQISIHAPMRGATSLLIKSPPPGTNFNPRAHEGRDCSGKTFNMSRVISIHAPMRGATYRKDDLIRNSKNFNPRAHEGRDFISTILEHLSKYFNPRAHEGRDSQKNRLFQQRSIFQSTRP